MSLFDDSYQTIADNAEGMFRDKGSKFMAYAYPFADESRLKAILIDLRSQHPKARHWCYAYRLTPDRSVYRVNDDGEPAGSAGRPILNTLLSHDLTNILVVVVRYFGGTLLGIPGLINAYKSATQAALESASIVDKTLQDIYRADFQYAQMNDFMRMIKEENLTITDQSLDLQCSVQFQVPQSRVTAIMNRLDKMPDIRIKYIKSV